MKNKRWMALLVCVLWLLQAMPVAGDDPTQTVVDFSNGNIGFLAIDQSLPGAGQATLALLAQEGGNRAKVEMHGEGTPYFLVDVASLLGETAVALRRVEMTIEAQNPDGTFHAVSGEIFAYCGADQVGKAGKWSIYLESKNPNVAKLVLADADIPEGTPIDLLVFSKKVDNALEANQAPSDLLVHEIRFLDGEGSPLPVDAAATLHLPEGFGEADRSNLLAVTDEAVVAGAAGASSGWGQAVAMMTAKNDGPLDAAMLTPGCVLTVLYTSPTPPELILQSWTEGAPGQAGWAKVAPAAVNGSGTICQFVYADMAAAFGSEDFAAYLDQVFVGDTGEALAVTAVTLGPAQ